MFKRKRKKDPALIRIVKNGEIIYAGPVYELPLSDSCVIAGSIAFFDDPEPCMIHRTAVISRYYTQIERWLEEIGCAGGDPLALSDFPDDLREMLDLK
jgi:hypothetical protein